MMSTSDSLAARRRSRHSSKLHLQLGSLAGFWHTFINVGRVIIIGSFITAFIIIGSGLYFIRAEIAKFRNAKIVFVSSDLDEAKNTITLALIQDTQLELVTFADTLTAEVGKHGQYQLRAVYPLLLQEKYTSTEQNSFFSFIFAQAVDGVVPLSQTVETPQELRTQVWGSWREGKLPLTRAAALIWLLSTVDEDKPTIHGIRNWEEWQDVSAKLLPASLLSNCSVAVINSTTQGGLAQAFNQVLEREGVEIIRLGSVTQPQPVSKLLAVDDSCPKVIAKIQQVAPVSLSVAYDQAPEREYRAKILLMIGDDISAFSPQLTW